MIILAYRATNLTNGKSYVGITRLSVDRRWKKHVGDARSGSPHILHAAIRKYGAEAFKIEAIAEAVSAEEAARIERGLIAQYGTLTPGGYNCTTGGEVYGGGGAPSQQTRALLSASIKATRGTAESRARDTERRKMDWQDPEKRERIMAGRRALWADPERKAAFIAKRKATIEARTPEGRDAIHAKRSNIAKRRWADPAYREKHAASMAGLRADPAYRDKISAACAAGQRTPEARAKRSMASKAMWERPEYQAARAAGLEASRDDRVAAQKAYFANPHVRVVMSEKARVRLANSPETRRKISETAKARHAANPTPRKVKPEPTGFRANPEYRAKVAAQVKALWADPLYRARQTENKRKLHLEWARHEFPVMPIPFGWGG